MPAKKQVIKYLPLFQVSDLLLEHLDGQPERGVASRHGGVHGGGLLGAGVLAGDGIGDDRSGRHDNDDDRGASTTEKKKSGFKSDSGISCHRRIGLGSDPTGPSLNNAFFVTCARRPYIKFTVLRISCYK